MFQSWTGASGTTNVTTVTMNGPTTVTANFAPPPTLTVLPQSRPAGSANLSMGVKNAGGSAAPNVKVTSISNITASGTTFVYKPGSVVVPFIIPGAANLKTYTSGFNLNFQATSASAGAAFTFTITVKADNVALFTTTITVPQ